MRFRLTPLALSLFCAFATAAYADDESLILRQDRTLINPPGNAPQRSTEPTPAFISADHVDGVQGEVLEATGKARLRKQGQAISADRLLYRPQAQQIVADGNVQIEQDGNVIWSRHLELNLDTNIGDMEHSQFWFGANQARGEASSLHLQGRQKYVMQDVNYTICPVGDDGWLLKVRELEIDRESQIGTARGARVEFMGVPILYTPWMDFALNDQRKSGFLGPVFGSTVKGGSEVTLPYFWNIAPNRDVTLSPRVMLKRGILLNNEARYLDSTYAGEAHLDVLPDDRVANRTRSFISLAHTQSFGTGLSGTLNLNRVSDDAYFRDLANSVNVTSQTNLTREGVLSYNQGWWSAAARVQSFQTLQDPAAPVAVPYRRLPQLSLGAQRTLTGANVDFVSEYVNFGHPTSINGQRLVLYPSVSYPLVAQSAFYLTPKLGVHSTYYNLGENNTSALPNTVRTLPILSLDSGITLERDWNLAGHDYVQTLEPRAYYVYIPYRDQSLLPNFDSAEADFSFAQIFTENRFFGSDRIGDANQVTLALTSRLLDPESGEERLRVAVGQRFTSDIPRVNLVTPTQTPNKSNILFAASGQVTAAWSLDSSLQYNPNQSRAEKFNVATRYQPEGGKVLNLGYRFTRESLRQSDISTAWPLSSRWRAVARWNYSWQDKRVLEALGGLEYNESCWTLRIVAQRFATATQETSTGFFVQLELKDLVRLGSDPLSALQQSIPGYAK